MTSTHAFILYCLLMTGGFVLTAFKPGAPFVEYATHLTLGAIAYITKRLVQKRNAFSNNEPPNGVQ